MKRKGLFISLLIFFLTINTMYLWEAELGLYSLLFTMVLFGFFIVLFIILLLQILISVDEMFVDRQRLVLIGIMTFVLGSAYYFPMGLIRFSAFESENIFVAQREGPLVSTILKLKANGKFVESSVGFGTIETTGTYFVRNDTVFFENVSLGRHQDSFFTHAVIKRVEAPSKFYLGDIIRFVSDLDSTGSTLWITKDGFSP